MIYDHDKKKAEESERKKKRLHARVEPEEDELISSDHSSNYEPKRKPFDLDNVEIDSSSLEHVSS